MKLLKSLLTIARKELPTIKGHHRHWSFILDNRKNLIEWATNRFCDGGAPFAKLGFYADRFNAHSEPIAMKRALGLLDLRKKFYVVNIRLRANGTTSNSRPCKLCYAYLNSLNCGGIWYSMEDDQWDFVQ